MDQPTLYFSFKVTEDKIPELLAVLIYSLAHAIELYNEEESELLINGEGQDISLSSVNILKKRRFKR